jgi:hypothetical protein
MLSMLFETLELVVGSGSPILLSRLAQDRYRRKRLPRPLGVDKMWRVGNGIIRLAEESSSDEGGTDTASNDNDSAGDTASSRQRRGLGFVECLRLHGILWLPGDMFDWARLRFKPDILRQTAFVTGHFRRQFGRHARFTLEDKFRTWVRATIDCVGSDAPRVELVERVFVPLWNACIFRYSNWLLALLEKR